MEFLNYFKIKKSRLCRGFLVVWWCNFNHNYNNIGCFSTLVVKFGKLCHDF